MRASLVLVCLLAAPAFAEEEKEEQEHHHHENHVAVFAGGTTSLGDKSETKFTIGADYERRLTFITHDLGVGVLVDSALGSETETFIAGFVAYHPAPIKGLMIMAGAGEVILNANDASAFAVRGGAAYFMEMGGFSLGPAVSIDHANGENAVVYGLSAGKGF